MGANQSKAQHPLHTNNAKDTPHATSDVVSNACMWQVQHAFVQVGGRGFTVLCMLVPTPSYEEVLSHHSAMRKTTLRDQL
jgi:hypothetical protein